MRIMERLERKIQTQSFDFLYDVMCYMRSLNEIEPYIYEQVVRSFDSVY